MDALLAARNSLNGRPPAKEAVNSIDPVTYIRLPRLSNQSESKTARAWALKETAMALCDYAYEKPAASIFAPGTAERSAVGCSP
jgi:hypothetical protein